MSRAEAVIATLQAKKERLKKEVEGVGPPCSRCQFGPKSSYSWDNYCLHPLFEDSSYDIVTGKLTTSHTFKSEAARQSGSACGPDAYLFQRKTLWRRVRPVVCHPAFFGVGANVFVYGMICLIAWLT